MIEEPIAACASVIVAVSRGRSDPSESTASESRPSATNDDRPSAVLETPNGLPGSESIAVRTALSAVS